MLNMMFSEFDRLCDQVGVYKVETVSARRGLRDGGSGVSGSGIGGQGRAARPPALTLLRPDATPIPPRPRPDPAPIPPRPCPGRAPIVPPPQIGDAYMIVSGHDGVEDHAPRMMAMAQGMLEAVAAMRGFDGRELQVRARARVHG